MSKYNSFIFDRWDFNPTTKQLQLFYSYDNELNFCETYTFDFEFVDYDIAVLEQAIKDLFFMAGVSYYKSFLPQNIFSNIPLSRLSADFYKFVYQNGLGEFFYVNNLDPKYPISFPSISEEDSPNGNKPKNQSGLLIGIGGGKDSLVTIEALKNQEKIATWSVGHKKQLSPLIKKIGLPHLWVERQWDKKLLEVNDAGAYNGHIPISAILAAVGIVVAVLSGYRDIVVSNENSANEPTLHYRGKSINHQFSKSIHFEQQYQEYIRKKFGDEIRYYSFLRPLSELRIAEIFAQESFYTYKDVFSSCNRAYVHGSDHMFWCGDCPKCAFTYVILAPFIDEDDLSSLWSGQNLLNKPELEKTYRALLGINKLKPLDCVGEIKESRTAMLLAQKKYPNLKKYSFDTPSDYNYRQLSPHAMPNDISAIFDSFIKKYI